MQPPSPQVVLEPTTVSLVTVVDDNRSSRSDTKTVRNVRRHDDGHRVFDTRFHGHEDVPRCTCSSLGEESKCEASSCSRCVAPCDARRIEAVDGHRSTGPRFAKGWRVVESQEVDACVVGRVVRR